MKDIEKDVERYLKFYPDDVKHLSKIKLYTDVFEPSLDNDKGISYGYSIQPFVSCPNCKECKKKCYMNKSIKQYYYTRALLFRNWMFAKRTTKKQFVEAFNNWISSKRTPVDIFRIQISGDFFNQLYFDKWIEIARQNPDVVFLVFTKSFNKIDLLDALKLKNFRLIISAFEGMTSENVKAIETLSKFFPISEAGDIEIDGITRRFTCHGNCSDCGYMCCNLKAGESVTFKIH